MKHRAHRSIAALGFVVPSLFAGFLLATTEGCMVSPDYENQYTELEEQTPAKDTDPPSTIQQAPSSNCVEDSESSKKCPVTESSPPPAPAPVSTVPVPGPGTTNPDPVPWSIALDPPRKVE